MCKAKLSLKVVLNKQKSKVLFAEAKCEFAEVLISFLTLPLGKIVRILEKHYGNEAPAVGSFNTLYGALLKLHTSYFCVEGLKQMLLNPTASSQTDCRRLSLDISKSHAAKYFVCQDSECPKPRHINISLYSDIAECECGKPLKRELVVERAADGDVVDAADADGGFVKFTALSFIITDDLLVEPIVNGFIETLNNLGITDIDGAAIRIVRFGIKDIVALLKLSLTSPTPLTDLIMKKATKCVPLFSLHHIGEQREELKSKKKMLLKVSLQKSTNKFLFAQATDEFVEFLLSLLTLPLGKVCYLLEGNTSLPNINNLYHSVRDVIDEEYLETSCTRERLINPKLPHGYTCNINQFLPVSEETPPKLYYEMQGNETVFNEKGRGVLVPGFKWSGVEGDFVRENIMCFVTDDLRVSPGIGKSISILKGLGIPLSDVKEIDMHIGVEEALRILKASLTSTTVLTDALVNPMLKVENQPKRKRT